MNFAVRLLAMCVVLVAASPIHADLYPAKPLTMIIPFPAGGRTDLIGRIFAQGLQDALGKPVAVINKPGASSVLGSNEVAAAAPDGYTLGFFSTAAVTAQYTVPTPLSLKSFDLIAIVNADPAAIAVAQDAPWKTLRDLVTDAAGKPGTLRLGMIPGASSQIFAAGFSRAAKLDFINVPFKGDTDGAIALAGNHIDLHFAVPASYKSLVEGKKVRMLAIAAEASSPLYGNIPTFKDNGVDLTIGAFHGVFAPAGTPASIIQKISDALKIAVANPELAQRMNDAGAAVEFRQGEDARAYLEKQDDTYRGIIEALGLRVDAKR
ncbi:MAG TPA: tripartite tricarboxylate transporter substrate binding protein [Afipia sp.]